MRIGGLQKFSLSDFPGRPAALLFTQGCNFRCPFCHNGSLLPARGENEIELETIFDWLKSRAGKLEGVVVTGGEPCLHNDLPKLLADIKRLGFKIKLDTNGSFPDMVGKLIKGNLIDFIAMDIKASWDNYDNLCGAKVKPSDIATSIKIIAESGIPHLFRTTFVPKLMGDNDRIEIEKMIPKGSQHITQKFRPETALDPRLH